MGFNSGFKGLIGPFVGKEVLVVDLKAYKIMGSGISFFFKGNLRASYTVVSTPCLFM